MNADEVRAFVERWNEAVRQFDAATRAMAKAWEQANRRMDRDMIKAWRIAGERREEG